MNKYFKPVGQSLRPDLSPVSRALAIARLEGFSILPGLRDFKNVSVKGMKSYYGEQMFHYMATGHRKVLDSTSSGVISVSWRNHGFDTKLVDSLGSHLIEVKTIFQGNIIPLSVLQERYAGYLAIYNPRTSSQSISYRNVSYDVPSNSYVIIKLQ